MSAFSKRIDQRHDLQTKILGWDIGFEVIVLIFCHSIDVQINSWCETFEVLETSKVFPGNYFSEKLYFYFIINR